MITDAQSRMARAALRWNVRDLARYAEISAATVNRFEMGRTEPNRATIAAMQRALEGAGVEFLAGNGVRLSVQVAPSERASGSTPGSTPGSTRKPAAPGKAAPRAKKPASDRQASPPSSKLEQIRALREQGAG
jgi:transcriptional regulator with XRE-family HTH domain